MITVSRPINGICLNPQEFLLDEENGKIKLFKDLETAQNFMLDLGVPEEDLEAFTFAEEETDVENKTI